MPILSKIQNSFTAGELDPTLRARTDIASYYSGASKLRNVLVAPQGYVTRRPGLEYMTTIPAGSIQMISFVYSETEHYLCILTAELLSIYKDGALIEAVTCSITEAQIPDVTWTQSYDTLLIFHKEFTPQAFIRASEASWSVEDWALLNIPSKNFAGQTTTGLSIFDNADADIDFSDWTTGNTTTECKFVAGAATWDSGSVGDYIRGSLGGYALITAYTDSTNVVGTILAPFTNDDNGGGTAYEAGDWSMEEASWSSTRGYPSCGTLFQGRLWMANTASQPNTLWASRTNDETCSHGPDNR